VINITPKQG